MDLGSYLRIAGPTRLFRAVALLGVVLAAAMCGCVPVERPATGLVRREGPQGVLPVHKGPAAGAYVGELDLPLYQVERISVRGYVVAFAYGQTVRLVDFSPSESGVPALRELFKTDDGSMRLMLGRTGPGFPIVTTRTRTTPTVFEAVGSAASGEQELPRAAWLQDDGALAEIESGLPAGKGVECWAAMGASVKGDGTEMMVSASRINERPELYLVQRGKARLASPLVSGVTEIVSATDGTFVLAIAEMTSVVLWPNGVTSHQLEVSNARSAGGRGWGGRGWGGRGASRRSATPLLWPGPLGASGGAEQDLPGYAAMYESGVQRVWLHGIHPAMALRLPAQVQQIAAFGAGELVAIGERNMWRLRIEAKSGLAEGGGEIVPDRASIRGFVRSNGAESLLGDAGVAFRLGASARQWVILLVRGSPGRVSVRFLNLSRESPE